MQKMEFVSTGSDGVVPNVVMMVMELAMGMVMADDWRLWCWFGFRLWWRWWSGGGGGTEVGSPMVDHMW